jgi:hypothetical protein
VLALVMPLASALLPGASLALEPIDTDGPDFVESSEVVPEGRWQIEQDVQRTRDRREGRSSLAGSTPMLFKGGFARDWEWRVAPEGWQNAEGHAGWGRTALGLKWHVQDRDADRGVPAISFIGHLGVLGGSTRFGHVGAEPSLRSVITWELPRDYALGLMPGLARGSGARVGEAERERFAGILGVVLNHRLNEQWRVFVEYSASQIATASGGGVVASWDVGTAWLLGPDTQIGARTGVAANRNSPDHYLLLEIAQRF